MNIFKGTKKSLSKLLLSEGVESKNMRAAKHYLYDNMHCSENEAMNIIGNIKTDIPNSRLGKCKFMLAMVRMFHTGEFSNGSTITDINKTLKYVASNAHINEYDQNLNGLTAEQIIQRFTTIAYDSLEQDKQDVSSQQYNEQSSRYMIVRIDCFEDAEDYASFVSWCVTQDEYMYNSYTHNGTGVFYFCLRDGYEFEEEVIGENCPLDDYGLSMIAVSINSDGSCNTITCRWNHDNGGNDSIMTPKELSQVVQRNFYETFKPLTTEEIENKRREILARVKEELEEETEYYGVEETCEPYVYDPDYGDKIEKNVFMFESKYGKVIIDENANLLSETIFDEVWNRYSDIIPVKKDEKWNIIDLNGNFLSQIWFDNIYRPNTFRYGYAFVGNNNKQSILNTKGELMFPWVDAVYDSSYKLIKLNGVVEYGYNGYTNYRKIGANKDLFETPPTDIKTLPMNVHPDLKAKWRILNFNNQEYYQLYDVSTGQLVTPLKISPNMGTYLEALVVKPYDNPEKYYIIHYDGEVSEIDGGMCHIRKESVNKKTVILKETQLLNLKK